MECRKDEAETTSGTDPTVDESTDLTWYEWEESAEVVSGKVPLAMPAIGEDGEAKKYPSMPCVTSERIQHREKAVKVVRFFDALVSRPVGRKEMLTNPDWADFLGCHGGWDVQMADAVQAYIQATLRGTPCCHRRLCRMNANGISTEDQSSR